MVLVAVGQSNALQGQFGYGFFPLVGQHLNKDIDRAIMLLALHSG